MSPLDYLKKILHPTILVDGVTENPKETIVKLKEENQESKTGEISLHLPPDSVVFRLDMGNNKDFLHKSPFFNESTKNIHAGCDYVVFCRHQEKYWFVLIELKSDDTSGAVTQLCCSTLFVRYLRELIFAENGEPVRFELTCLLFSTASKYKRKEPTNRGKRSFSVYQINNNINRLSYYGLPCDSHFYLTQLLNCESQTERSPEPDLFNRPRCRTSQPPPPQARLT